MKILLVLVSAFALICIGWAIHPGVGVLVALLTYGGAEGLLRK